MTKQEQIEFVRELCASVSQSVIAHIVLGDVPGDWNGLQLRHVLADAFCSNTRKMTAKDRRDYLHWQRTVPSR